MKMRDRALAKIRDYVYSLNRPELDYEGFEGDFRNTLRQSQGRLCRRSSPACRS